MPKRLYSTTVPYPVVALVASAGGIEVLGRVLAPLPAALPATVLVSLHQAPGRAGLLAELLNRRTALPVRNAVDGDAMVPGSVLVAPPGHHMLVTSPFSLALIASGAFPPARPSADLLLATLAVICGPLALAVVLTGTGTDGQAGIRAVAHECGTVFAQDRASSPHFAMPFAAAETGLVEAVLPPDALAARIRDHVAGLRPRPVDAG
ncbi:chemotaxis protein CheB [Streptomyces sp. CB02923]|uniref:chemotaxis protein CheB n=1 Tax=Streptomyces sp. CB02923 TaxID=1718985 RepID=UPI00093F6CA9|nr:chemotaxis protein CheB [Streptomyces sp. CB02923]OKI02102.1 chemotaxis protein CheB [Streptomyces sp. CB02923]